MNKQILLSAVLLFSFLSAFGQPGYYEEPVRRVRLDANRIRLGGFIAPNVSWMQPTANKSSDGLYRVKSKGSKVGFTWGLLADYFFSENYAIATGFQVNSTGGKIESTSILKDTVASTVHYANFDYNLKYLEVPFMLKLRSDELAGSGMKIFGQVGLTAGANIGKKVTYDVVYIDHTGTARAVSGDKEKLTGSLTIAPLMLQLNIGAGIERPISEKMALYFGAFYNNGFLPDATDPGEYDLGYDGTFSDGKIRLNSLSLRLGLFF